MGYQLELKDAVKDYGKFRAVDHINLQIPKGEIVCFLGASGCGKTTTLRMIAGLLVPTEGEIYIEGEEVTTVPPYKRDLSMVFQNYALFPHMTVFNNVVYGLRNRGIRDMQTLKKKASEVFDIVQLHGYEEKFPGQLSGGQQQRVSLARALIVEPRLMLFDEPLSNLDAKLRVSTRIEIRNLLKQLNITGLYVTHDQEEAMTISDRIAIMNKGKIEQSSSPFDLYNKPASKFVGDFIGHANIFEGTIIQEADATAIKTDDGSVFRSMKVAEHADGERKAILIRPENIVLTTAPVDLVNDLHGEIVEFNFLGSLCRYLIRLDSGNQIEAEIHPDKRVPEGTKDVYVGFPKEKCVIVNL